MPSGPAPPLRLSRRRGVADQVVDAHLPGPAGVHVRPHDVERDLDRRRRAPRRLAGEDAARPPLDPNGDGPAWRPGRRGGGRYRPRLRARSGPGTTTAPATSCVAGGGQRRARGERRWRWRSDDRDGGLRRRRVEDPARHAPREVPGGDPEDPGRDHEAHQPEVAAHPPVHARPAGRGRLVDRPGVRGERRRLVRSRPARRSPVGDGELGARVVRVRSARGGRDPVGDCCAQPVAAGLAATPCPGSRARAARHVEASWPVQVLAGPAAIDPEALAELALASKPQPLEEAPRVPVARVAVRAHLVLATILEQVPQHLGDRFGGIALDPGRRPRG